MSTLVEIETAARQLPPNERRRLLVSLAQSLREVGQSLPDPREFTAEQMQQWMDEDEQDLKQLRDEA